MSNSAAVALKAPYASVPELGPLSGLFIPAAPPDTTDAEAALHVSGPPAAPSSARTGETAITWIEPRENLWVLALRDFGLTLATFGVYHFWGRAESRRRTINAIHVDGRPLDYTGTGKEAFVSFVVGMLVAVVIVGAFLMLFMSKATAGGIEGVREIRWQRLSISLPLLFLMGSIAYRKRHHILRRTWLAGERFALSGHAWLYAWSHFWSAFLVPLSLGWAAPWRASRLERRKLSEMTYGALRFEADGELRPLYKAFALLWFGAGVVYFATLYILARYFIGAELVAAIEGATFAPILQRPVLGVLLPVAALAAVPIVFSILAYRKAWLEHLVSALRVGDSRLTLRMPLFGYIGLALSNAALTVGSLGAFAPVAHARWMRYVVRHVSTDGPLRLCPIERT